MSARISGAFAPVPTPLDGNGWFDAAALQRHLAWLAEQDLDGALILGTNGEFPSFSLGERREIARAAAVASGTLTLLLNVGSCALGEATQLLELAASCGYSGVLCPPPFYYRTAPVAGVAEFFRCLLDAAELPMLLYHIPQLTGIALRDELLDELGAHPQLQGIKDSSGEPAELARLARRFCDGSYLVGRDQLISAALAAGGAGSITACASIAPELVSSVREHPSQQVRLDALRQVLDELGLGPAVKAVLRRRGFGAYATRPPLVGLGSDDEAVLWQRLEAIGFDIS